MSGLAGIRWFDENRQASLRDVRPVLGNLAHRGPDGLSAATSGPCVLGFAQFITTPEAHGEEQPFTSARGAVVTFDGRLDNGDELRRALRLRTSQATADVEVVAAAWDAWGVTCLERLLGDFALAVWDAPTRRLWLARDVFGLRPLCYRAFDNGFWWASEVQALARAGDAAVNEGMVGEYLADGIRSESETLVRGIMRVPRAGVLTLNARGAVRVDRYWAPRVRHVREFASDREAVEEFRSVFSSAVKARLRSDRPLALTLSGGLDSSLIAYDAAVTHGCGPSQLETFTLSLPNHPADESPYAVEVAAHLGLPSTTYPVGHATWRSVVEDAERALDMPQPPNSVAANVMSEGMRDRGFRVSLNGVGGNEWFSGYHFPFADLLRQGRWLAMIARMRAFKDETPTYRAWSDLRLACWMQLPAAVKDQTRRVLGWPRVPEWIDRAFAERIGLSERLRVTAAPAALPTHQLRLMYHSATCAAQVFFTEYTERLSARFSCEERAPFLDRRLVEWALALPDDQRWREGAGKILLRRAAEGVLPQAVAARRHGPDFSFQTVDGLEQIGGERLVMSIAEERGDWLRKDAVRQLYSQMTGSAGKRSRGLGHYSWVLWLLVGVHLAARAIENCRAHAVATPPVKDCTIAATMTREAV